MNQVNLVKENPVNQVNLAKDNPVKDNPVNQVNLAKDSPVKVQNLPKSRKRQIPLNKKSKPLRSGWKKPVKR